MRRFARSLAIATVVGVVAAACTDDAALSPTSVPPKAVAAPLSSVSAAPSTPAAAIFLPPLGPAPINGTVGALDQAALPYLTMEICEWAGTGCLQPLVRRFGVGPDGLQLGASGDAIVADWRASGSAIKAGHTYRFRVLASGQELGFLDVLVVGTVPPSQSLPAGQVLLGSSVRVRFVVPKGVGQPANGGATTISLAGGQVALNIPAGALSTPKYITAVPATTQLPVSGPAVIPGTAWEFGPTGTQFAQPVIMTIAYDPAKLPTGTKESELRIHKLVNGSYVQQNAGTVDLVNHTVSAEVTSFSVYVLLQRLFPGSQQDTTGPQLVAMDVQDPSTGLYGRAVTIDVSSGDINLRSRFSLTDDLSGVAAMYVEYDSPSGRQVVLACPLGLGTPLSGSDTNGQWECVGTWPRYGEVGAWTPRTVQLYDKAGNLSQYSPASGSSVLCEVPAGAPCVSLPVITVRSTPSDITPPAATTMQVSPDISPRNYSSNVSVDVGLSAKRVVLGFQATDDLSGLSLGFAPASRGHVRVSLQGPSNQVIGANCSLARGTTLGGLVECAVIIPRLSESGTWWTSGLTLYDLAGNHQFYYAPAPGPLCNSRQQCITAPTVQVSSKGDGDPPFLTSLGLSVINNTVNGSLHVTDDFSGTASVLVNFASTTSTQVQGCFGTLKNGSALDGDWICSATFSQFAARGIWYVDKVVLTDSAGNERYYYRQQSSTDTLCYGASTGEICRSFGPLDVIVQ